MLSEHVYPSLLPTYCTSPTTLFLFLLKPRIYAFVIPAYFHWWTDSILAHTKSSIFFHTWSLELQLPSRRRQLCQRMWMSIPTPQYWWKAGLSTRRQGWSVRSTLPESPPFLLIHLGSSLLHTLLQSSKRWPGVQSCCQLGTQLSSGEHQFVLPSC